MRLSRCYIPSKLSRTEDIINEVNPKPTSHIRPALFKLQIIHGAAGSAYVELADAKVICSVHGPRPKMGGIFSDNCQVYIL